MKSTVENHKRLEDEHKEILEMYMFLVTVSVKDGIIGWDKLKDVPSFENSFVTFIECIFDKGYYDTYERETINRRIVPVVQKNIRFLKRNWKLTSNTLWNKK